MPAVGGGTGGGGGGQRAPRGALVFDVRDYGAQAGAGDCRAAFQAAHDACQAAIYGTFWSGIVFIPSAKNPYVISSGPIFSDAQGITWQGEGRGSVVEMTYNGGDMFVVGVSRTYPTVTDASYRPDCFGKLDASACPAVGQKYGVATKGDSGVMFQFQPISSGCIGAVSGCPFDLYGETTVLTFEFCVEPGTGTTFPAGSTLFSIGAVEFSQGTFGVRVPVTPNGISFNFNTENIKQITLNPSYGHAVSFMLTGSPPYRVAICVDLNVPSVYAFCNGTQVAVSYDGNMGPSDAIPLVAGVPFRQNEVWPFTIGADGITQGNHICDMKLYGLRVSNICRYQNRGVGQTQTRADQPETPINDAWAYFSYSDTNTITTLACTPPDTLSNGRLVEMVNGLACGGYMAGFKSGGYYVPSNGWNFMGGVSFRDLAIYNYNSGACIAFMGVLEMVFENLNVGGGFTAIANIMCGSNYIHQFRDCTLNGIDSCIFVTSAILYGENVNFGGARVTMRSWSSGMTWQNCMIANVSNVAECAIKNYGGGYGNSLLLDNFMVDMEGNGFVGYEACGISVNSNVLLRMKDVNFGTFGMGNPFIRYRQGSVSNVPPTAGGWIDCIDSGPGTSEAMPFLEVDGPGLQGRIRIERMANNITRLRHLGTYGDQTSVVMEEVAFQGRVPAENFWHQNTNVFKNLYPVDGQFLELRCIKSGTYGTVNPPVWAGINPVSSNPNAIATYVQTHRYSSLSAV